MWINIPEAIMSDVTSYTVKRLGTSIILPAKSRSDVMFCLQSYGTKLS